MFSGRTESAWRASRAFLLRPQYVWRRQDAVLLQPLPPYSLLALLGLPRLVLRPADPQQRRQDGQHNQQRSKPESHALIVVGGPVRWRHFCFSSASFGGRD